jgi:hypothetical protein
MAKWNNFILLQGIGCSRLLNGSILNLFFKFIMSTPLEITFGAISDALYSFDFPEIDLVLGLSEKGKAPALMIAHQLGVALKIMDFSESLESNDLILSKVEEEEPGMDFYGHHRILIVDDMALAGKKLSKIKEKIRVDEVYSFALFGEADFVLFPKVKSKVKLPWAIV